MESELDQLSQSIKIAVWRSGRERELHARVWRKIEARKSFATRVRKMTAGVRRGLPPPFA